MPVVVQAPLLATKYRQTACSTGKQFPVVDAAVARRHRQSPAQAVRL
jgi:hypothetical protein